MSRENVELVRRLQPAPDTDLVALFGDDTAAGDLAMAVSGYFHPGCECVLHMADAEPVTYHGLDGWRRGWRDWLAPWQSYRSEIEEILDAGEDVLVLVRDYARREQGAPEVTQIAAAVWTVRAGLIARVAFHTDRARALETVELAEQG